MKRPYLHLLALLISVIAFERGAAAQVEDDLREGDRRYDEGEFRKAGSAYDSAIRKYPGQVPAEAYAKRAGIFIITKDLDGGLAFIRDVAKKQYPDAPEILEYEAVILWQQNKKADAIVVAEKVTRAKPSAFLAQNMIGEYSASRDPAKTAGAYEAYLQHRPTDQAKNDVMPRIHLGFAHLSLARVSLADGNSAEARGRYVKAVEQFETLKRKHGKVNRAVVNANTGLCAAYTGLNKFDQAITVCEAIVRNPRQVDDRGSVWLNLGRAYLAKKQATRARTAATEYTKLKGKEARGYILIGDAYFQERNYQLALENYLRAEQLLKANQAKEQAELAISMGKAYRQLPFTGTGTNPNLAKAIEKLEAGIQANPQDNSLAFELGSAYLQSKDDAKALAITERRTKAKDFDKAPRGQQKDLRVIAAKALYNLGKIKESRSQFEEAYKIDGRDIKVRRGLVGTINTQAYQALKKQDAKGAANLLDQAASVDGSSASISLNRAVLAIDAGDCDIAQRNLDKIKSAEGYTLLYQRLMARSYLCLSKPNKKKAAEHYAQADKEVKKVQANLIQAEIYTEWAPLLIESGGVSDDVVSKLQDAVQFSAQAPEIQPAAKRNLAVALFRRGWVSLKAGKSSEAASDFERAGREPSLLKGAEPLAFEFSYALALLDKGDATEAAKLFKALAGRGNQSVYLKAPYNKVGTTFFAAYASYRSGTIAQKQQAAKEFAGLQAGSSGAFAQKVKDLVASSWEYVAYDHWKSGSESRAGKALTDAVKYADGDLKKRITHNRAVLSMKASQISTFESLGATPPEALVNLGILYDNAGKPKDAYEAWTKAAARGVSARDLRKWIDAKKRIYGFN